VCYAIRRVEVLRETNPDVDGLLTVLTGEAAALATDCHERKVHRIPMPKMQDTDSSFAAERLEALAEQIANRVLSKPLRNGAPSRELDAKVKPAPAAGRERPIIV
jgi:hypothetical protein